MPILSIEERESKNEIAIFESLECSLEGTGQSLNNCNPCDLPNYQDIVQDLYQQYLEDQKLQ